jgi:hypothetical protein
MEEDCGEGQVLSWAVEPRRERENVKDLFTKFSLFYIYFI